GGLGVSARATPSLGSTATPADGPAGREDLLSSSDGTTLTKPTANRRTMSFVGSPLEGPAGDSGASVWGLGAPDPAERPRLEVTFSDGAVPEPPGALLIGLGLAGMAALARWCDRRGEADLGVPAGGGAR